MKRKLIDLDHVIGKIERVGNFHNKNNPAAANDAVYLTLIIPPSSIETEHGLSHIPAECIEICGTERLLKLSDEIRDFCELHKALVKEQDNA